MQRSLMINEAGALSTDVKRRIIELEKTVKEAKKAEDELRKQLLEAMNNYGIKKIDSDELTITKKEATYRESFNSKEFKKDHEDLYNEYVKLTEVRESLMIKVK